MVCVNKITLIMKIENMEYKKIFLCLISFKPAYIEIIEIINSLMLSIGRDGISEPLLSGKNKRNMYIKKKEC